VTTLDGPDLLTTIVAAARRTTEVRAASIPAKSLERRLKVEPRGARFEAALRAAGRAPRVIAECKRRSPSKGILRQDYDPAAHARAYEAAGAAAISVLTEPTFFDGAPEHLTAVRGAVGLPILRKDFIVTEYQVLEAAVWGADAVLLIVGAVAPVELQYLMAAAGAIGLATLVEVHDRRELGVALDAGARIVGVNSRNLRTLAVDTNVLDTIGAELPPSVTAVAESGIKSRSDLDHLSANGYHAFLVGERLIGAPDPGAALRELRGP
jgi:indole-3-glycerol phosphate synthase